MYVARKVLNSDKISCNDTHGFSNVRERCLLIVHGGMKLLVGGGIEKYVPCRTIIDTSRAVQFSVVFWKVRCVITVVRGAAFS